MGFYKMVDAMADEVIADAVLFVVTINDVLKWPEVIKAIGGHEELVRKSVAMKIANIKDVELNWSDLDSTNPTIQEWFNEEMY